MARENQGLQIALIIFVMLTIVLGVTTYLCYRNYDDAAKAKVASDAAAGKNDLLAKKNADDAEKLKKFIGVATTENVPAIEETFNKDKEKFGGALPEEDRVYRRLLEKLQKTIDERNAELDDAKKEIPKREDEYKTSLEAKELQVKQFQAARDQAGTDLATEQTKFQTDRERSLRDQTKLQADLQIARKETKDRIDKIEAKFQEAMKNLKGLEEVNTIIAAENQKVKGGMMVGAANGEITWVNQRNATVWINLGQADGLMRQVTFSVYADDVTDTTAKGAKKGSIEVTEILGDHLAQARVLDDDIARPMLPKDKIFTPLWSPGERRHFALAGLLDVDGDGRSDLETLKNLIAINGGVVDCYVNKTGEQVGKITANTNSLILGKELSDKDDARQMAAYTKIRRESDQLRLPIVQLTDLLQRMGWRNMSPVVRYGRGSNPNDFRAKPEHEVPKKSTGSVSDVFEKRQPPKAPASAY